MPRARSWAAARQNKLLAALPDFELERVERNLQPVFLSLGLTLYEPGIKPDYAYFPVTSMVSLEYLMADGASAEIAAVGSDGLVGIALFMGGESRPNRAVVQIAGWAYRLKSRLLREEFARGGPLQRLLLRYTMALMAQTAQTAVCNRHHSIDQQLCRWLLLTLDRVGSTVLTTTHEQIAHMLGVRREGVTEAAGILQRSGLVHCSRGRIVVVDRAGIEGHCCECYGVVKRELDRLLPHVTPPQRSVRTDAAAIRHTTPRYIDSGLAASRTRGLRKASSRFMPSTGSVIVNDDDGDLCDCAERCASGRVLDDDVEELG
jgi:CRP-like cAMP-binding protein